MKKLKKVIVGFLAVFIVLAAGTGYYVLKNYGAYYGIYIHKPTVSEYVEQAIRFADRGIYADSEDWHNKKADMRQLAKGYATYAECYEMISEGVKTAGGKHSKLLTDSPNARENEKVLVSKDCNGILTIKIPAFMDGTRDEIEFFVQSAQSWISENSDCKGVIIDLRGNTGGDAGPMLAACAPLLPNGTLLSFDVSGMCTDAVLTDDSVSGAGSAVSFKTEKKTGVPVAILQDEMTASSGEITLLAFRGLDYVKTFGKASAGYCSCNNVYKLYDGARLLVTIGKTVARTGEVICEDPIQPDVECDDPRQEAVNWILRQG